MGGQGIEASWAGGKDGREVYHDINNCYFHPNLDDQCHSILDVINNCYFHPNLDDQCHPILDDINNCYFHLNLDDQCHPLLDFYSVIVPL